MDEADKYKQRLEAIAEKRRLQEEQDRTRREMEEEKLRLQQLKRKSLRDQWLMEGAPLSPASPDGQSPRSPLWGSQAQEIEKHIDKLPSDSEQRLAEEEEKLKEQQMEDGQTEAAKAGEVSAEIAQAVVQNGDNNATGLETTENQVKTNQSPPVDETTAVLTNGKADTDAPHDASEQSNQSITNGPVVASEGVINMKLEPGLSLSVSEAEPGQILNVDINEEEEGTLVIRAERVIITDEGDDVPEALMSQEDQEKTMQTEEILPNPEAGQQGEEAVEEVIKTETAPETFSQPAKSEAAEPAVEAEPATADGDMLGDVTTDANGDGETKAEDPTSAQVQPPANAVEGTTLSSVPIYAQSAPNPDLEAEDATSPVGAEATLKAQEPATLSGQFQEVPLVDPKENQRTEAVTAEQEPLLSQSKAPDTLTEQVAANSPFSTETNRPPSPPSPSRASQGEETPKRKTCQCCSVM